jgi:hypothetical protein
MTGKQIKGPLQLLGELILKENTRTLVIHGKDHTIASLPLGFAVVAGIVLLLTMPPLVVGCALLMLYSGGGSISVEGPKGSTPPTPHK